MVIYQHLQYMLARFSSAHKALALVSTTAVNQLVDATFCAKLAPHKPEAG